MAKNNKFIISGGGTGGHIYPAISIAKEIGKNFNDCELKFIGAKKACLKIIGTQSLLIL